MVFEGFLVNLANSLGIPLGAKMRKGYLNNSNTQEDELQNLLDDSPIKDFINSIIDITKDDVCIGESPLFYQSQRKRLSSFLKQRCQSLCDSFNDIIEWVAIDLLKVGVSVYTYSVKNDKAIFRPLLKQVQLYLREDNTIQVVEAESHTEIENVIVFVYYEKSSLEELTEDDKDVDSSYLRISPVGIQTKNLLQGALDLQRCENSIARLREQTSKVIRFASVEVGVNSGDKQQAIVDDISEGLNANSEDLVSSPEFDDQIPVFPTRKGLGKPEYEEHYSSADLDKLSDLDYNLSKVFLAMRFPKSYADFSQNLTPTAVSMIRGDIRYAKLLLAVRTNIERTINDFASGIKEIEEAGVKFKLTQVPSSEDDDLIGVLSSYTDFADSALESITAAESEEEALSRLEALRVLYSISTNAEGVEKWAEAVTKVIKSKFKQESSEGIEDLEETLSEETQDEQESSEDIEDLEETLTEEV